MYSWNYSNISSIFYFKVDIRTQRPKISIWGYLTYQIWMGTRVFPGVAKMAIWGLCANPTGMGGGGSQW